MGVRQKKRVKGMWPALNSTSRQRARCSDGMNILKEGFGMWRNDLRFNR